ncbi:MAG: ribonuclease HII [Erysipelotrichaceae bacterium]|nr:ribonuclease HII [Erysipelotrichaceae bacterium]
MIDHPLELDYWDQYDLILGMDEAGRGPICGPMMVAGVIFPKGYANELLDDSKKLTEKKREALYHQICKDALWYQILCVSPETIDEKNIYQAAKWGMEQIARNAGAEFVLSDAMPLGQGIEHEAVIKGDSKSLSIAAASILAKVSRDHYMKKLDALFPQYGLAKHKGYPTKAHLEAIDQYGVQDFYRRTYAPVQRVLTRQLSLF